jgi:hypothetical protein
MLNKGFSDRIIKMCVDGMTHYEIALKIKSSEATISRTVRRLKMEYLYSGNSKKCSCECGKSLYVNNMSLIDRIRFVLNIKQND